MFRYHLDDTNDLIVCRAAGRTDFMQISETARRLFQEHAIHGPRDTLFLIEDTDALMSFGGLPNLKPLLDLWRTMQGAGRWAVVLPNATGHAMVTIALKTLEAEARGVETFLFESDARAWLSGTPGAKSNASTQSGSERRRPLGVARLNFENENPYYAPSLPRFNFG